MFGSDGVVLGAVVVGVLADEAPVEPLDPDEPDVAPVEPLDPDEPDEAPVEPLDPDEPDEPALPVVVPLVVVELDEASTTTVPCMNGWIVQMYANVPACVNVCEALWPF